MDNRYIFKKLFQRLVAMTIVCSMLFSYTTYCESGGHALESDFFSETIFAEDIEYEDIEYEHIEYEEIEYADVEYEYIEYEEYWTEDIIFENTIVDSLLAEDMITEVHSFNFTIIDQAPGNFIEDNQLYSVYGTDFDYNQVLNKIYAGGGIILATAIVKVVGNNAPIAAYLALPLERAVEFSTRGALMGALTGGLSAVDARLGLAVSIAELLFDVVMLSIKSITPVTLTLGIANIAMSASRVVTAIDTYINSDVSEFDWSSFEWEKVGYATLDSGATGFAFGAAVGAVAGSVEAAVRINKAIDNTRIDEEGNRIYKNIPQKGRWSGKPGDSDWFPDPDDIPSEKGVVRPYSNPDNLEWRMILRKYDIDSIPFKSGYPDFSQVAKYRIDIPEFSADRKMNFSKADEALAKILGETTENVSEMRTKSGLTWHEAENMKTMLLVPHEIHANVVHGGGVSNYKLLTEGWE